MTDEDRLQGVWRLETIEPKTPAAAGTRDLHVEPEPLGVWTHLVFDGEQLRYARADEVRYADEGFVRTLFRLRSDRRPPVLVEHNQWVDPDRQVTPLEPEQWAGTTAYSTYTPGSPAHVQ